MRGLRERFNAELKSVPAEGLAEIAVRLTKTEALFNIARTLEAAAYAVRVPDFDGLPPDAKAFMGAVLDFFGVERSRFAGAWSFAEMSRAEVATYSNEGQTKAVAQEPAPSVPSDRLL